MHTQRDRDRQTQTDSDSERDRHIESRKRQTDRKRERDTQKWLLVSAPELSVTYRQTMTETYGERERGRDTHR